MIKQTLKKVRRLVAIWMICFRRSSRRRFGGSGRRYFKLLKHLAMSHRKFSIKVRGGNSARVITEITINAVVRLDRDKLSFEKSKEKVNQINADLEAVIEKYFEVCDWLPDTKVQFEY